MPNGKALAKNTGILFIGKISTQFISFLLLPLYTAKLTTDEYGMLDLYTTIAIILIPIISLQLEQAVFRYLLTSEEDEETVLSSMLIFLVFSALLTTIIFIPIAVILSIQHAILILIYYMSMLFFTVLLQIPRGYGNYLLYTFASFLSSSLSIFFAVVFICFLNLRVEGVLVAYIISQIFTCIYIILKLKLYNKIGVRNWSVLCLKSMLKYSIPLVFNQLTSWFINFSDRIIIVFLLGVSSNGVYAIANKFFSLITTTFNIYNVAWTESVIRTLDDKNKTDYYNYVFNLTTKLFLVVSAGIVAGVGVLFKFVINSSFYDAYYQIPILVYAAVFSGLSANVGSMYIAHKKTREISKTTFQTAIINIVVNLVLIKFIGLYAASISTLLSFGSMFFIRLHRLKEIEHLDLNKKMLYKQIPLVVLICAAYYSEVIVLQIISLVCTGVCLLYILHNITTIRTQFLWFLSKLKMSK